MQAAILQQATDYIGSLKKEKAMLLARNAELKRVLGNLGYEVHDTGDTPLARRKQDTESSDEGVVMTTSCDAQDDVVDDLRRQVVDLREEVDRERQQRTTIEEQHRGLIAGIYTDLNVVDPTTTLATSFQRPQMAHDVTTSRRGNLLTIIEAIRHLEGERTVFDVAPSGASAVLYGSVVGDDNVGRIVSVEHDFLDTSAVGVSQIAANELVRDVTDALHLNRTNVVTQPKLKVMLEHFMPSSLAHANRLIGHPGVTLQSS